MLGRGIGQNDFCYNDGMKRIVVAGGTDGIGLAFIKELNPKEYETIYILGRDFAKVRSLQIANVVELGCDITDQELLLEAISSIDKPIDQFVNTIGIFHKAMVDDITSNAVMSHFELNAIANINLTNAMLKKLNNSHAAILVCSATLALEAREAYALQSATKVAYRYYLEALRNEKGKTLKVMLLYPSSVNTDVFRKAGDTRDTSLYPKPEEIARIMKFMLDQPKQVHISDLQIRNHPM